MAALDASRMRGISWGWWWIEKNYLGYIRHIKEKMLLSSMFDRNPRVSKSGKKPVEKER